MTVSQFILRVRRRSQDLRTLAGSLITSATENGIRWGAADILDACNQALDECSRLISVYDNSPLMRQLTENNLIAFDNLNFTSKTSTLGDGILAVIGLEKVGSDQEYKYIEPMRLQSFTSSELANVVNSFWFTVIRNASTLAKECRITSSESTLRATLLLDTPEYALTELDLAKELPFQGIDDFLECLAEKKLRTWEGHHERVNTLLKEVQIYLGVSTDGKA